MNNWKLNSCSGSRRNWEDLPKELLEKIGEHFQSRIDVFRYRAVCSSWRSAISLSNHATALSPRLIPPSFSSSSADDASAFLFPVTICRLEDHHRNSSCLVKVVQTALGQLDILNPLSIPKSDFILGKSINLLECRLFELAKGYHTCNFSSHRSYNVQKALVFRNSGILAIYDFGMLGFRNFDDENWTNLDINRRYHDILMYQGGYFVIDSSGIISCIDKFMNVVKYLPRLNSSGQLKNLVESNGVLYVVDTYFFHEQDEEGEVVNKGYQKVDMKVYKLDEEWGTWVQVFTLDDRVFVLGQEVCFSVSATDFPGCQGNCIYFIDFEDLQEDFPAYAYGYYHNVLDYDVPALFIPPRSTMGGSRSPSLTRYYDEGMGYYALRVFKLDDRSMRNIAGSSSLMRLFSPPKTCLYSKLSFP